MIVILVGKSGCGKTYLQEKLLESGKFRKTVSHTTREPRVGEIEGHDYYFVYKHEFIDMLDDDEFVNYDLGTMCEGKAFYGTHKDELENQGDGKHIVMVLSPNGAMDIAKKYPEANIIHVKCDDMKRVVKMLERDGMSKEGVLDRILSEERFDDDMEIMRGKGLFIDLIINNFDEMFETDANDIIDILIEENE